MEDKRLNNKVKIFYDGLCHLCSYEMEHYQKLSGSENLEFVDITHPDFVASDYNLDPTQVQKALHVIDKDGHLRTAVDAFIAIWETLPGYISVARIASVKPVKAIMTLGYHAFAKIRRYLPKKSCRIPAR